MTAGDFFFNPPDISRTTFEYNSAVNELRQPGTTFHLLTEQDVIYPSDLLAFYLSIYRDGKVMLQHQKNGERESMCVFIKLNFPRELT